MKNKVLCPFHINSIIKIEKQNKGLEKERITLRIYIGLVLKRTYIQLF